MRIKQLKIKNFKSIASAEIDFSPLTMIVGANASGKSNVINVFRFISNIATDGIDNAIALQGGIPYLANASLPKGTPIEIQFMLDLEEEGWIKHSNAKTIALAVQNIKYSFVIQPNLKGGGYHIASDNLSLDFSCLQINQAEKKDKRYTDLSTRVTFSFERKARKSAVSYNCIFDSENTIDEKIRAQLKSDKTAQVFAEICSANKKELMLYRFGMLLPPVFSENTFIRIFDFDPNELKKASSMGAMKILDENGSNLASVLQNILINREKRKKLTNILAEFLPFVDSISVESNLDKSFSYKVKENFTNKSFHAYFLSDGTVSLIAIIIALYFEDLSDIVILEEPERNIHPKLLSSLLSSAEDVSLEKQIIITTHNPEFLKHAKLENIKLITRDVNGFTIVSEPSTSETVKCFIQNDLGIDDLFLQGLLGV